MPRISRKISPTGVYHVMLRGINRDRIFNDEQDCRKFLKILRHVSSLKDKRGMPIPAYCNIYAYCLMTNHIHLLLGEGTEKLASTMKRIGVAYVSYYNKRNNRLGPLFHDRFRSEPVESKAHFVNLLRYVHFNPVEAGIVELPYQYEWSSWHEYSGAITRYSICSHSYPFMDMNWGKMCELVVDSVKQLPTHCNISRRRLTDAEALAVLEVMCGDEHPSNISQHNQEAIVEKAFAAGVGLRQLARITNITYGKIKKIREKINSLV